MRKETIEQHGITYYFSTRVQPNSSVQMPNNIVLHTLFDGVSDDKVKCTIKHHDSILDPNPKNHLGWWAIYSIVNHKTEYDPPKYDPMNGI